MIKTPRQQRNSRNSDNIATVRASGKDNENVSVNRLIKSWALTDVHKF